MANNIWRPSILSRLTQAQMAMTVVLLLNSRLWSAPIISENKLGRIQNPKYNFDVTSFLNYYLQYFRNKVKTIGH